MKVERPSGPKPPDESQPVAEPGRPGEPKVDFGEVLASTEAAGASGAAEGPPTSVEALVGRLRAGEIGVEAVLDTLVDQAARGAPLRPELRDGLREMLKAALQSDPTLRQLVREIEQG